MSMVSQSFVGAGSCVSQAKPAVNAERLQAWRPGEGAQKGGSALGGDRRRAAMQQWCSGVQAAAAVVVRSKGAALQRVSRWSWYGRTPSSRAAVEKSTTRDGAK